jgi:hypothetical protein
MATNLVQLNVYQINQQAPLATPQAICFPTQNVLVRDVTNSPAGTLSTGVRVYSALQVADGSQYYVIEAPSALVTLFNA